MDYKFKAKDKEHTLQLISALQALGYRLYGEDMPDERHFEEHSIHVFVYSNKDLTWGLGNSYFKNHSNKEAWIKDGDIVTAPPLCYLHGEPVWADTPLQTSNSWYNPVWRDTSSILEDDDGFFKDSGFATSILEAITEDSSWEKFYRVKPKTEEKRISLQELVDNIVATSPGAVEVTEDSVPLVGLIPREIVDKERIIDILQAMHRFVEKDMPVNAEWYEELGELLKGARYVVG